MTRRVEGKVAFITGIARGQGRSHAVALATEGADIVGIDILEPIPGAPYGAATPDDLAETVRLVEEAGGQIHVGKADVRDTVSLQQVLGEGMERFGRLDIVCANAGIYTTTGPLAEFPEDIFDDMIATNLAGVWRTLKVAVPYVRAGGRGGSIIITSSGAGLKGVPNIGHYVAAKHGLVGLMRTFARELAPEMIRVNSLHPAQVKTPMILTDATYRLFAPDVENPTYELFEERSKAINAMPVPWVESSDVSNAVLFLASDEARFITGSTLAIDAGAMLL